MDKWVEVGSLCGGGAGGRRGLCGERGRARTLHILKKCRRLRHSVGYAVLGAGAYSRRAAGISSAPRALPSATASTTPTACQLKMRALTK